MKLILLLLAVAGGWAAEIPPQGAAMLKTDLMFVGAHPDDETGMAATLARYAGSGKTVAAVYCTRGEGGGNMVGTQAGAALGILREAELRSGLGKLGVRYVHFLDEEDFFYTESLAATLEKWNKEDVLGKLVRVVRSLRPEVVVTMNPAPNPGQHGHHQAAGVLAIEAFTTAADSRAFPEQLEREGLSAWQVKKLYIGGGGERAVKIRTDEPMANGKTPADLAALAITEHRSQAFGNFGNSPWLRRPQSFLLARSAVEVTAPETDLLDSVHMPVNRTGKGEPLLKPALAFFPRPVITRFLEWAEQNDVLHLAAEFPADIPVVAGETNAIRFHGSGVESVNISNPAWEFAGQTAESILVKVAAFPSADEDLVIRNGSGAMAKVRMHPVPRGIVVNRWDARYNGYTIGTNLIVQGSVEDQSDSSGNFTLHYDEEFLIVNVRVIDDAIISNIEPNDIKGHWRSDSVEICIDPEAGSEHTMKSFKLGIFPFDTTGKVRAARDADANQGPIERTAPGVKVISKRTAEGYAISTEIPWKDIGIKPKKGLRLGFNVIIYDGDKRNAAPGENINQSRLAWSPRPGVQGRPEDWGRIVLE